MKLHQGIVGQYPFDNGYTASVICKEGSFGYEDNFYELAVLHAGFVCYNTPISDDVVGNLSQRDLSNTLDKVAALPRNDACDHESGFLGGTGQVLLLAEQLTESRTLTGATEAELLSIARMLESLPKAKLEAGLSASELEEMKKRWPW